MLDDFHDADNIVVWLQETFFSPCIMLANLCIWLSSRMEFWLEHQRCTLWVMAIWLALVIICYTWFSGTFGKWDTASFFEKMLDIFFVKCFKKFNEAKIVCESSDTFQYFTYILYLS